MKRKKSSPAIVLCASAALICVCRGAAATPAQHVATANFQEAVQQQNFFSILASIEERLKSLDNIYSLQLSQTLETKLDLYNRRLEALDAKIIRLEALVMLNLDKISENISTRNFKDDISRTNLLRKMDSVYEGINHRLGYMERKYETNLAKVQVKVETTLTRLDKIEENITTRDSDIEAEISDTIFAVDDLKTTCTTMEEKLYNVTASILNVTQSTYKYLQDMNLGTRKSMNVLHDNIVDNLKFMNNRTLRHFKLVEDNNFMLKSMKTELKEDFNDYANKVADMNSYIWKNSDTTDDDLKRIETFVNNTKTEVQNGVRSLMIQIGKIPNKEVATTIGGNPLEEIHKNMKTNFQRILTNQDIFLESCHRLQMDEAQIESEISLTLENLIDMIEKKMVSRIDIENLGRALKTHDSRVIRNVQQINSNVISLYEKYMKNNEALSIVVKKIGSSLDDMFKFVQEAPHIPSINTKALQDKLDRLEAMILTVYQNQSQLNVATLSFDDNLKKQILQQLQKFSKSVSSIEYHVNNSLRQDHDRITAKNCNYSMGNDSKTAKLNNDTTGLDSGTRQAIEEIFGVNLDSTGIGETGTGQSNCTQNCNKNLRTGDTITIKDTREKSRKSKKKKRKKPLISLIDVRGSFGSEENLEYDDSEEHFESTTVDNTPDLTTEESSTIVATTTATD